MLPPESRIPGASLLIVVPAADLGPPEAAMAERNASCGVGRPGA